MTDCGVFSQKIGNVYEGDHFSIEQRKIKPYQRNGTNAIAIGGKLIGTIMKCVMGKRKRTKILTCITQIINITYR